MNDLGAISQMLIKHDAGQGISWRRGGGSLFCFLLTIMSASFVNASEPDDLWTTAINDVSSRVKFDDGCDCDQCATDWSDTEGTLSFFLGVDGSKQPQDYGVNANLGGRTHVNWTTPLSTEYGLGIQLGTALNVAGNAVRVYELLGESTGRLQSYTTVGVFQRTTNGLKWGLVYDFLHQDSFDTFQLGQWRFRAGYDFNASNEIGVTAHLSNKTDAGLFNATRVTLDPITQGSVYVRHFWERGAQTTLWVGLAEGHGETNAVTGFAPRKDEVFLFGADFLAPLNDRLALYGETNLMMPADTGTVDAYLGIQWYPWGGTQRARRQNFSPLLPVAGSTSFSVDLTQN